MTQEDPVRMQRRALASIPVIRSMTSRAGATSRPTPLRKGSAGGPPRFGEGGRSGDSQEHWYKAERELAVTQQEQPKPKEEAPAPGKASPGMAQVSTQKVPRPSKMSGRSVPDDSNE
jgi:hypothetical protein